MVFGFVPLRNTTAESIYSVYLSTTVDPFLFSTTQQGVRWRDEGGADGVRGFHLINGRTAVLHMKKETTTHLFILNSRWRPEDARYPS